MERAQQEKEKCTKCGHDKFYIYTHLYTDELPENEREKTVVCAECLRCKEECSCCEA